MEDENLDIGRRRFDNYIETLVLKYEASDPEKRDRIVNSLENFVGSILLNQSRVYPSVKEVVLTAEEIDSKVFDGNLARKIREQSGLSQDQLADILSVSQRTIAGYEASEVKFKKLSILQKSYLGWLKRISGYNPFNL